MNREVNHRPRPPRKRLWPAWSCTTAALLSLGVMAVFFFDSRPAYAPSQLGEPLLLGAQIAFPVLGSLGILGLVRGWALRAGNVMGRRRHGWIASACLFVLFASLSASNHAGISWGEAYAIADLTGIGTPGPAYEVPLMLGPVLSVPLLLAPVTLCLNAWWGEAARPALVGPGSASGES